MNHAIILMAYHLSQKTILPNTDVFSATKENNYELEIMNYELSATNLIRKFLSFVIPNS